MNQLFTHNYKYISYIIKYDNLILNNCKIYKYLYIIYIFVYLYFISETFGIRKEDKKCLL